MLVKDGNIEATTVHPIDDALPSNEKVSGNPTPDYWFYFRSIDLLRAYIKKGENCQTTRQGSSIIAAIHLDCGYHTSA